MAAKDTVFRFKIEVDLLKRAKKAADSERRTIASLIRYALARYLDEAALRDGRKQ